MYFNNFGAKMKSKLLVALLVLSTANAQAFTDDPTELFDTRGNYVDEVTVKWIPVDDVQGTCERESKKRGYGGFGYGVKACSFFGGNQCVIYTSKKTSMHSLGHETRHCFQGAFH